jgi:hypothetical protein
MLGPKEFGYAKQIDNTPVNMTIGILLTKWNQGECNHFQGPDYFLEHPF